MFCNQCGREIPDDSTFCNFCGTEVSASVRRPSPATKGDNPAGGEPPREKAEVPTKEPQAPEGPDIKPDEPDDERAKTKKLVLIISIAASVVLLGIILAGSLLLRKSNGGGGNDADNSFQVSRETANAAAESTGTVEQSTDAEESTAEGPPPHKACSVSSSGINQKR